MEIVAVQEILQKKNLLKIDDIISNDGILVYPTDTLYGLGGRFNSKKVIKKIDLLKKRANTPYSVAVSDVIMLIRFEGNSFYIKHHMKYIRIHVSYDY